MDSILSQTLKQDQIEELVSEGEEKLLRGHFSEGLDLFGQAEQLVEEEDASIYYRMGLSLFEYGSEEGREQALLIACKKFKKSHTLNPLAIDTLHAWGNTLTLLGETHEEHHFFQSALEKLEAALALGADEPDLYWDYGVVWYHIGSQSGEAVDFQRAIQSFEKAAAFEDNLPTDFWIDFGAACGEAATLVRDVRLTVKAVNCFKHGVSLEQGSFDCWTHLAGALDMLYDYTHDEDHFSQANDCFAKGAKLAPQEGSHWFEWAKFLLKSARRSGDIRKIRLSLEKCHYAYACEDQNGQVLATWAEALALLGQLTERLDLIYEAENKIGEALELDEEDPEIWYSLGMCFHSFGVYFSDHDTYYQAIEKFQIGLSIDRTHAPLWHAIASTYATVATLEEDLEAMAQALKFYEKALLLDSSSHLHIDYAKALSKLGEMTHEQTFLEQALVQFEYALSIQKNAVYLHPEWLYSYATTLDMLGDFHDEEKYYRRAIEIFSHVLMVDPDFQGVHHRLAQAYCHLGEMIGENDYFYRAIHHLRLALKHDEENDQIILDWGITLIHVAEHTPVVTDIQMLMQEAEQKVTKAAKLGNLQAYYFLSCIHSLQRKVDTAIAFLFKAAQFHALPPVDELLADDWLEELRSTSQFQEFLAAHPYLSGSTD